MRPNSFQDLFVRGQGLDLAVRDWGGSGLPILLLPGAGQTLVDLTPMAALLTARHRVIGMDWRGHGHSQKGAWTMELVLADIRCVISHFGFPKAILVGHSLGGLLATIYCARNADCVAAVNMDGQSNAEREDSLYLYDGLDPGYVKLKLAELKSLFPASAPVETPMERAQVEARIAAATLELLPRGVDPQVIREAVERLLEELPDGRFASRPSPETTSELMAAVLEIDSLAEIRRCHSPLLIFNATRHSPVPEGLPVQGIDELMRSFRRGFGKALRRIKRNRPNLRVVDVDATHGLPVEIPALLVTHIEDFLVDYGIF